MLLRMWRNWRSRHQNPTSLMLHLAGIPATVAAAPLAIMEQWTLAVGLFVGGYGLQFIGHIVEGNRSGEEMLLRRIIRRR